jgi:hypothetical protein
MPPTTPAGASSEATQTDAPTPRAAKFALPDSVQQRDVCLMKLGQMNPPLRGALVGGIVVGGATTLIFAFAMAPAAGVPGPVIGMFGLLGGVLGIVAGAVAGASDSNP